MNKLLPRIEPKPRIGCEPFNARGEPLGSMLLDYWRWSGSDLVSNVGRGVLAEFLVASALKRTEEPREEWGAFDVEVPGCGTVEVKSAAYIQSWEQTDYSRISFDIAKRTSAWNPKTGEYEELNPPRRVADVYVFCLLKHKCQKTIDPLYVDQWKLYVVRRSQLDRSKWKENKRIGLGSLASLTKAGAIPYSELKDEVRAATRELEHCDHQSVRETADHGLPARSSHSRQFRFATRLRLRTVCAPDGQDLFVVLDEDSIRPVIHVAVLVDPDLANDGPAPRLDIDPVDEDIRRRQPPFRDPAPHAKQHHFRVRLDDHRARRSCEIVEQEFGHMRVRGRMKFGLRMFDDVDARSCIAGGQSGYRNRQHMRKSPAGLHQPHVGISVERADVQLEVSAYTHDVERHSEDAPIPIGYRLPQLPVRRKRKRCVLSMGAEVGWRAFRHGERPSLEVPRTAQVVNAGGPRFQVVGSLFHPFRKAVRMSGE